MTEPHYRYVSIEDPFMAKAYQIAKAFYVLKGWNLKTCPIALVVQNQAILAAGVSGDGMHQMRGQCSRVDQPGSPYDACEWCREELHAEQDALRKIQASGKDPRGATCYLYGHYKMCSSCIASMTEAGITDFVLLDNASVLFNRHVEGTVVGTHEQFAL